MHILGTGLSGMVGSRIVELLKNDVSFEDLSLETGVNILNADAVRDRIKDSSAPIVLHMAAKTDIEACEKETDKVTSLDISSINSSDWKSSSSAFAINVVGTKNIANACAQAGKKCIYISTDFVFPGTSHETYSEDSTPNPTSYYGLTKFWGEQVVQAVCPQSIIMRIAFPYGATSKTKLDFVERIKKRFVENQTVSAITGQIITPTYIEDIAKALVVLIQKNYSGIVHVVGSSSHSPNEIALAIAQTLGYDKRLVKPVTYREYYQDKTPRPQFLTMSNAKLQQLGYKPRTFIDGLSQVYSSL